MCCFLYQWSGQLSSSDSDTDKLNNFVVLLTLFDEELDDQCRGGSVKGCRPNIERLSLLYDKLLHNDYWGPHPIYNAESFKKRFRIPIGLFDELVVKVQEVDSYFIQNRDAFKKLGLSARQKVASAMRTLASGTCAEQKDDQFWFVKKYCLRKFKPVSQRCRGGVWPNRFASSYRR